MATQTKEDRKRRSASHIRQMTTSSCASNPDELSRRLRKRHLKAVPKVVSRESTLSDWIRVTIGDLRYYCYWFVRLSWETLASLPRLLLDPLAILSAILFLVGSSLILFGTLLASVVWRLPYVQNIWRPYSDSQDVGLGNIVYPQIFEFKANEFNRKIRDAAFAAMSDPLGPFAHPSTAQDRVFDLEIAKLLMILSALVYERNGQKVHEAIKNRAYKAKTNQPVLDDQDELTDAGEEIENLFQEAEQKITRVAKEWDLHYSTISELDTNTSPLCGAFWNPAHNFIVLAFKGTNPVEFKEWAIDFTFDYVDGRAWLPGFTKVHSGFYTQIFPQRLNQMTDAFPYTEIRTTVADIAEEIRISSGSQHVNLYVTGHSLGAALASLFYSRALASPKDFGLTSDGQKQVAVRDAYCFGTPVVGDPDCISAFNQTCHDQNLDHPQTLWRITNKRDAVATLLPEGGDYDTLKHISPASQLHFAHIGQEIQLTSGRGVDIKVYNGPGTLLPDMSAVSIVSHLEKGGQGPSVALPTYFSLLLRIPLICRLAAHAPSSYWSSLTKVDKEHNIEFRSFH